MTWTRQAPPLTEIHGSGMNYMTYTFVWRRNDDDEDGDDGARSRYDLNAPYQRGSVWTVEMRRLLIKSLLHGIAPGAIYISKIGYDPDRPKISGRIIDGKQRIETVQAFHSGEFAVPADWWADDELGDVPDDGMVTYNDLSKLGQSRFEHTTMPAIEVSLTTEWSLVEPGTGTNGNARQYNIRDRTPDEVLVAEAEVYLLLNNGGVDHTPDDLIAAANLAGGAP